MRVALPVLLAALLIYAFQALDRRSNPQGSALDFLLARLPNPAPRPDPRVVIVAIDDATLDDARVPKWGPAAIDRTAHTHVIHAVHDAGAAAIGMDVFFDEPSQDPFVDLDLAKAMDAAGSVVMTLAATPNVDPHRGSRRFTDPPDPYVSTGKIRLASPIIRRWEATQTVLGIEFDQRDGERRVPAFAQEVWQTYRESQGRPLPEPVRFLGNSVGDRGDAVMGIRWPAPPALAAFTVVPYRDVWDGTWLRAHPDGFRGKIVLIGRVSAGGEDVQRTPVGPLPGVAVHAAALQTLLDRSYPLNRPLISRLLTWLLFALVTLVAYRYSLVVAGVVGACLSLIVWAAARAALLHLPSYWIDPVPATLAVGSVLLVRLLWQTGAAQGVLRRFVDPDVADELLRTGRIVQRQREATVLYTDVRNYTDLSERLEPDQLLVTLNRHFAWMDAVIRRHGGRVNKHTGDALMALFQARGSEHALRAASAAAELLRTADQRQGSARELRFGIGIHSGIVAMGELGASKAEYAAIGDAVNVAARLESATKESGVPVLISASTAALLEGRIALNPLGEISLRGKAEKMQVFTLAGE